MAAEIEALAWHRAVQFATEIGLQEAIFEGDAEVLIKMLQQNNSSLFPMAKGKIFWARFCIKTDYWWLGFVVLLPCFCESEKYCSRNLYFFLIIVKSLQLHRRRQIAEPCKYCLMRVIVFFFVYFLYFFVSHRLGIRVNFLQFWLVFIKKNGSPVTVEVFFYVYS